MTQEEKFKEAKRLYETANADQKYVLESLFPELAESEDERIRKALIKYLDALDDNEIRYGVSFKDMRTWLEKQAEQKPTEWNEEDEINLGKAIWYAENPAPMVAKDSMLVEWLKNLRGRVLPQHKQEWSEEDEKKLLCICAWIKDYPRIADFKDEMYTVANNYIDWLKSLRPQNRWKPSTLQMEALDKAIYHVDDSIATQIAMLIGDLRKL